MKLDYRIAFINDPARLQSLCKNLESVSALALDIETINWWNPLNERIALIQLAYRVNREVRVAVIDGLAGLDPSLLRQPLEHTSATKVVHNAAFDTVRLRRHFKITTAPIHDTMLAARRNGEKRYSLKAQAEKHLNLVLNKSSQQSDWSRRPLSPKQLDYAALDAVATLLLYEHQVNRGLRDDYRLRAQMTDEQGALPLGTFLSQDGQVEKSTTDKPSPANAENAGLSASSLALLGIITELPTRYSPQQLIASIGFDRVGLAGWIIDRMLGEDADLDESSAKIEIAELLERGLIKMTLTRRLEVNEAGRSLWQRHKPV